jgi:CrcB protein
VTELAWWGWVAAVTAGSAGALLRTWVVRRLAKRPVPLGVLLANTVASAVGGAVVAHRDALGITWSLVLIGGFCGGLSTLSTLAADTVELWVEDRRRDAVVNVVANVAVGLAVVWGAWAIVS